MNEYPPITSHLDKQRVDWLRYCDWGRFVPILDVSTTGGMANRILGLASCIAKATLEKRVLVTYWPLNGGDGTSVKWEDIFVDKIHLFSEWDLYWLMDIMHEVKWYDTPISAYSQVDTNNLVVMKSSYDFFMDVNRGHPAFDHSLALHWLKSLKIQPSILEQTDAFGLKAHTLGVHLRVREAQFSDNLFVHDPITPELCDRVKRWPGEVLVVSNCEASKLKLKAMFPEKVIMQKNIKHDRTSEGTQSAMVDLLLLSKCKERVGNNLSTFFKLANYWA
jgi:hypothetical protein